MIINNAPANEAILSNVSEIGEFRIRNSAKAFNILSSGLYANKIRAVIRELSCNAVDSHAAAGNKETPFDVHLPNQLEPWFAVRDYGTGLSHEQVTNIYTTYFESTKTASNEFIGALGLGSKSPFSYTDNFTVTAIKDGIKGVYSAFINEAGVPSIAKMGEEDTTEPAGVEVKFSVNDRWDFDKFKQEARIVYTYFKLRPVVTGVHNFDFSDVAYETENIIPGVHACQNMRGSKAVMGNIAYPIDIPNADQNLGELSNLLYCGLEMHFDIGELDFQASREGLSYIPQTIASIKKKLEAVNAQLAVHIAQEADAIDNLWTRTQFLLKKKDNNLWSAAVTKYVVDTKFPLINHTVPATDYNFMRPLKLKFEVKKLAKRYNIEIRAFNKSRGTATCSNVKPTTEFSDKRGRTNHYHSWQVWDFYANNSVIFVKNNTKVGAFERAKHHFRNTKADATEQYTRHVYVLDVADKTKPAQFDAFLKALHNPPNVMWAEDMLKKERAGSASSGKNVTIMRLEKRGGQGYHRSEERVWRDAGDASTFDSKTKFYYLPLSGYNILTKGAYSIDAKTFATDLRECGFSDLDVTIYGVRKGDIEYIKLQKNWVNIEDHVTAVLSKVTDAEKMRLAFKAVDKFRGLHYNNSIASLIENTDSPFLKQTIQFKDVRAVEYSKYSLGRLCSQYASSISVDAIEQKLVDDCTAIYSRYPLLGSLETYRIEPGAVAEYINLIDAKKGV